MKTEYFCGGDAYEKMSEKAAEFVAWEIKSKPGMILGLPTGSTPLGMYSRLIEMNRAGEIDFSKVTTFNLDEYYPIKKDSEQSYYKFMFDNFFNGINIDAKNINIPNGEAADAETHCKEYDKKIESLGGLDLMVLGMGTNGHIGFNEPCGYLLAGTHVASLTESTKKNNARFFASVDEVPTVALTMGMGSILQAKKILLIINGEPKKSALKEFLTGKITTELPASFLHLHKDVTVLSDVSV